MEDIILVGFGGHTKSVLDIKVYGPISRMDFNKIKWLTSHQRREAA